MLAETLRHLRCPLCGASFEQADGALRCARGHSFDLARQGYVNLLTGRAPLRADTPAMVAARTAALDAGHFDPIAEALADAASAGHAADLGGHPGHAADLGGHDAGFVVDVGAGTGFHLGRVLDRLAGWSGLALDVSPAAVRRAARAHRRADAAVCDAWAGLPLADGCAGVVLNVFAPRNGPEFRRILRPDGVLLVLTPRPDHLAEMRGPLGLLGIDPAKDSRLDATLGGGFRLETQARYRYPLTLSRADAANIAGMGPSAWHAGPDGVADRVARLPKSIPATASVTVRRYLPVH